jgi:DNA mismatch endonuclease (patch repair protein)
MFAKGYRYRIGHGLFGKPDIVFVSGRVAVFIDGCFWHRCPEHFRLPASNTAFWDEKLNGNVNRDRAVTERLRAEGWCVLRFWEHQVKRNPERVVEVIEQKLRFRRQAKQRY